MAKSLGVVSGADYRALRKELGVSQVTLAKRLNLDFVTILRREKGYFPVHPEALLAIRYLVLEMNYDVSEVFE